jgi:hypothetical protein
MAQWIRRALRHDLAKRGQSTERLAGTAPSKRKLPIGGIIGIVGAAAVVLGGSSAAISV